MYLSEEYRRQKLIDSGYLNLDRNENHDCGLNKKIKSFLNKSNLTLFYPNYSKFILKLSKFLKIKKNNLLITNGCSEAIRLSFNCFINDKTNVLLYMPTYMYAVETIKKLTTRITYIDYSKDPVEYIKKNNINFFYICNPNNPTGDVINEKKLKHIVEVCSKLNCKVFIDEAYYDYCNVSILKYINKFQNLLIGRTFSKAWGLAGERIGFIASHNNTIKAMQVNRLKASAPTIGIYLAEKLLDSYHIVEKSLKNVASNRSFLKDYISKNNGIILNKDTTNFIYFKSKKNIFKNKKIIIRKLYGNYCIAIFSKEKAKKILC